MKASQMVVAVIGDDDVVVDVGGVVAGIVVGVGWKMDFW